MKVQKQNFFCIFLENKTKSHQIMFVKEPYFTDIYFIYLFLFSKQKTS